MGVAATNMNMRSWMILVVLLLEKWGNQCHGCWEDERNALLQIKSGFNHPRPDDVTLSRWGIDADCCTWDGVGCNETTKRVTELEFVFITDPNYEGWYLNISLFFFFKDLNILHLRGNQILGCIENEGFEKLSRLTHLENLYLGSNKFNKSILSSLHGLSFLKDLDLSNNRLNGIIHTQELNALSQLENLHLNGNEITKFVAARGDDQEVLKMSNLKSIYLAQNKLDTSILSSLKVFFSLKSLDLNNNQLKGSINVKELNALSQLEDLDLSGNEINGFMASGGDDQEVLKLRNLKSIYLAYNKLDTSILSSLKGLSSLKSLDLSYNQLKGSINVKELNALGQLKDLDLSGNEINGFIAPGGDDQEVLKLRNLKSIYLVYNKLDTSILSSLKELSSLKSLDLKYNQLKGSINVKELNALSQLEELDLSGNEINGFVAPRETRSQNNVSVLTLEGIRTNSSHVLELQSLLGSFPNLKTLYLSSNNLQGTSFGQGSHHPSNLEQLYLDDSSVDENFLQSLGALVSLKYLSMQRLNGSRLPQGLCNLNQLQELLIRGSNFSGTLPPCMSNLTSLRTLDLFNNQLTGNISLSPLKSLTSLINLDLSYNRFQIPMTLSPFFNHTKLTYLFAEGNNIFSEIEQHSLAPKFKLIKLFLSGYGFGGKFPKFLYYQHELQSVGLSNIQMSEGFPHWLLENNTDLVALLLVNSSLSGQLRLPRHSHMSLTTLDISENCFRDHVPAKIGALLPSLEILNMSRNGFDGSIPPSLGKMKSIQRLDLSHNRLSGEVPGQLLTSCLNLRVLALSNNSLQGQISSGNWRLRELQSLQMDRNNFTGTIPDSLRNSSSLKILDLSYNNLHGTLPQWIGNMSELKVLDVTKNNISGSLPSNFPPGVSQVYLSKNRLQGSLENAFYNGSSLVALDLSNNYFTGSIPKWVATLSNLSFLLLNNNKFKGEIPTELCKLDKLRLIDFSCNHLLGNILPCLRFGSTWDATHISDSILLDFGPYGDREFDFDLQVEFTTKNNSYSYKGRLLSYMCGINLSGNNLTGVIPPELGNFSIIKVLNLSHNSLTGPIPSSLSNLKEIESLDLSYNNLNAKIPPQFTQLYQLAVFTVRHNNLSGKTPDRVKQFATFENSSYEDNPFLCGPPLTKSCNALPSTPLLSKNLGEQEEDTGFINMDAFYPTFLGSYIMVLLGMAAVLYINPYWRRAWFYFVEECINSCYYFIVENLPVLSRHRASQPCI